MAYRKRNLDHPGRAKLRTYVAAFHNVTEQRLLETIRKRKEFSRAKMFRRRSRKRHLKKNPNAQTFRMLEGDAMYSGEGELHALIRAVGMTPAEFCRTFDIPQRTFHQWRGFPLHAWPIELLRYFAWADTMARYLEDRGIDPAQFKPKIPERPMPTGRYTRKEGDIEFDRQALAQAQADWSPWTAPGAPFRSAADSSGQAPRGSKS